jgi:hypothetical protein
MARLTRQELEEESQRVEEILDEIAAIMADEDLSEKKKLAAIDELVFEDEEDEE